MSNLQSKTIQLSPAQLPQTVSPDAGYAGLDYVELSSTFRAAWQSCSYDSSSDYMPTSNNHDAAYLYFDTDFLAALGCADMYDYTQFSNWQFWRPLTAYQYQNVEQLGSLIITTWNSYYDSTYNHAVVQSGQPWRLTQVWNARSATIRDNILGRMRIMTDLESYQPGCILKFTGQVNTDCNEGAPIITYSAFFMNFLDEPDRFWLLGIYAEELNAVVALTALDGYLYAAFDGANVDLVVDSSTL